MNNFDVERKAFEQFKETLEQDPILKNDIEEAFSLVLTRFATSIRENRFVVGGVIEAIIAASLRASGIEAENVGADETRIDIRIPGGGFSVKGHFSIKSRDIRLINVLGASSSTRWETATLFVLHGKGIAYADPNLITSPAIIRVSDAIVIRYSALCQFLNMRPKYLINCNVPPMLTDPANSELASRTIAREVLASTEKLKRYVY